MDLDYLIVDAFAHERFSGNPAAVVLDGRDLSDATMQAIAAEFNLSETTFVLPANRSHETPEESDEATKRRSDGGIRAGSASDRSNRCHEVGNWIEREKSQSFIMQEKDGSCVRFRWFTPRAEAAMCGHATVAGVHALIESGRLPWDGSAEPLTLRIETRSGLLTAFVEALPGSPAGRMIWLELRPPRLVPSAVDREALARTLRISTDALRCDLPMMETQDADLLVLADSIMTVNGARPDFSALGTLLTASGLRGMSLATVNTLTPSLSVQSRFFAPALGIDEDPVTGSVHGPLAAYLVRQGLVPVHDGTAGLMCAQGKPGGRTGVVYALVECHDHDTYGVRIGGHAVTTMRGALEL